LIFGYPLPAAGKPQREPEKSKKPPFSAGAFFLILGIISNFKQFLSHAKQIYILNLFQQFTSNSKLSENKTHQNLGATTTLQQSQMGKVDNSHCPTSVKIE